MELHRAPFTLDRRSGALLRRAAGGVLTLAGRVPVFEREELAARHAERRGFTLSPLEGERVELDVLALWLSRDRVHISPTVLLAAWEMFADVARSTRAGDSRVLAEFEGVGCLYDKLFWASVSPDVELTVAERAKLRWVLAEGLRSFRAALAWSQLEADV